MVMSLAHPVAVSTLIILATLFSFLNGAKDGANALAPIVMSRAMSPRLALWMVSIVEFLGPFVFGVAVAETVGDNIVAPGRVTLSVAVAALLGANAWNFVMARLGMPSSSTHALIGGLIGSVLAAQSFDWHALQLSGLIPIAIGLFLSPIIALTIGYLVMRTLMLGLRAATPRVNWLFVRGQVLTTLGLAASNGANDATKAMGIISLGLVAAGVYDSFSVPMWEIVLTSGALAAGTLLASRSTVRTVGTRFYRLRPFEAFNSQLSAGIILIAATILGSPVSASQLVSSAIVGVGAARRLTLVRWSVMGHIVVGWILTVPATIAVGAAVYLVVSSWMG